MALGVLNNISALYAENNLNTTNSSLQTVLQQLSSGSKINSGSDDAAGLSLINGLQANSTALTQSATNASEGVGLLQVADGALSQVTSLLNRAVTLATESANGTLTTTQAAAANQEYSSILSEINNIGSTTTFNSNTVFGGTAASSGVNIYTGDSTSTGSSIDNLHFAALSSTTVGDSGGSVVQSSAGDFIDLSKATASVLGTAATASDAIKGSLVFTTTNADATTSTITTTATTVSGLIAEINKDGINGVSASLSTVGATGGTAGATTALADVGLLISNTSTNVTIAEGATSIQDTTSGQAAAAAIVASTAATETISYQSGGTSEHTTDLAATNLSTAGSAQSALTTINSAISDVAAQRGYLGAQVNTLNAISSVATTQQENITSAQNSVQATDYAQASTNLSKYEILSQTGISALAQANSLQQEVTKLLQ
jgi:flagellin